MSPGTIRIKAASRYAEVTFDLYISWQEKAATKPSMPTTSKPVTTIPTTPSVPVVTTPTNTSTNSSTNAELYKRKKNFPISIPSATIKIANPIDASQAPVLMNRDVSVLLYNASMLSSSWTFVCV